MIPKNARTMADYASHVLAAAMGDVVEVGDHRSVEKEPSQAMSFIRFADGSTWAVMIAKQGAILESQKKGQKG